MPNYQDPATIKTLAEAHFGLTVSSVKPLMGEVDLNYRLNTAVGTTFTLKISRPEQDEPAIRFQYALLAHLAKKDLPFATPRPVGDIVKLEDGRLLRLLTWVPGRMLDDVNPITQEHRAQWGQTAAYLTNALADFGHPDAPKDFKWNPSQTLDCLPLTKYMSPVQAELAEFFWDRFERDTLPHLPSLPCSVNFNDAHGHNLLVGEAGSISGVIDFGDAMHTHTINELAIACAYAGMGLPDAMDAMAEVVAGYGQVAAEQPDVTHLFNLIIGRLLITVATAAQNMHREPENEYLQVSAAPAWALLKRLRPVPPAYAAARFRSACGTLEEDELTHWLKNNPARVIDLTGKKVVPLDLSVGSLDLGNYLNYVEPQRFSRRITRLLEDRGADFGYGGYGEVRPVYTTDDFATDGNYGPHWRTVHLGTDIWGPALTPVLAPYDGVVHSVGLDPTEHGYGNVIVLEHKIDGLQFYTLYGHLSATSTEGFSAGTRVQCGDEIAWLGTPDENGHWPPHLHFQVMRDMLGFVGDFPGVAFPEAAETWLWLCPEVMVIPPALKKHQEPGPEQVERLPNTDQLMARRKKHLGYSLSVSYRSPLRIDRGRGQYLLDHTGRRYLDTVNNVAHVGHEHPAVVEAIQRQAAVLNTNARYLHENVIRFAE